MSNDNIVFSTTCLTHYPGVEVHNERRLASLLRLERANPLLPGNTELIDQVWLPQATIYCDLPGYNLPKETAIGSCRLRLVVLRNLFMIVQATAVVSSVGTKKFERLRSSVSRGGAEWAEILSSPGRAYIIGSKTFEKHINQRVKDFLNDRLTSTQLDLWAIINDAQLYSISRLRDQNKLLSRKSQLVFTIDNCCRVAAIPGDDNNMQIIINGQGATNVQSIFDRQNDLSASAEHWGLQTVTTLSIAGLLNQLADRHEREAKRLVADLKQGNYHGLQQALIQQLSERIDFLMPALDIWSRFILPTRRDNAAILKDIDRDIESLRLRLENCSSIFRELDYLNVTNTRVDL